MGVFQDDQTAPYLNLQKQDGNDLVDYYLDFSDSDEDLSSTFTVSHDDVDGDDDDDDDDAHGDVNDGGDDNDDDVNDDDDDDLSREELLALLQCCHAGCILASCCYCSLLEVFH